MESWHDAQPDSPALPPDRVPHRPWSTILLVIHVLGLAAGILALGFGVAFVVAAAIERSDPDGINEPWGLVIGMLLMVGGGAVGVIAGIVTKLTVAGRREAEQGRPGGLRTVAIVVLAFAGVWCVATLNGFSVWFVFGGLYALPAVFLLRATRSSTDRGGLDA